MSQKIAARALKKPVRNSRKAKEDILFEWIVYFILALLSIIIVYPLWFVIIASFSEAKMVISGAVLWRPVHVTLENYAECLKNGDLMIGYRNSLGMLFMGTAVNLVLTILCAYPLSRRDLWGKSGIMLYVTFPMFFSGGMIPTYLLVSKTLHLTNSWWAVILVGGIVTYNMILMRTFFSGCTPFGILFRIILPLSIPVICVIGLYYGVYLWNSYFQSLIYLTDKNKWPLQLFLRQILVANDVSAVDGGSSVDEMARRAMRAETIKYAIVVLASVPMLIIYPFVQRYFVKGVMIGSVKG